MKPLKAYAPAIGIFCLALFVRIVYNMTVASGYIPTFDAAIYNNLAKFLVNIHCYCRDSTHPSTFRSPLWPFIIATIYTFLGDHSEYARLFYCLLDSVTCVFVYLLAKDLFGKRIALITGIIAAMYAGLFVWTGWLYTETLYTFCLTGLIFSLFRLQQSVLPSAHRVEKKRLNIFLLNWPWVISSGIFLGLTLLARPTGSIFMGLLALWAILLIICKIMSWRPLVKSVVVILVIALLMNIPWFYRNYQLTHTFIAPSTIGTTLVGSYNDNVFQGKHWPRGIWEGPPESINPDFADYTKADEQQDTARAINWMRTHVSETITLLGLHVQNMWTPYLYSFGLPFELLPDRLSSEIMLYLIPITSIPIFLLAAMGLLVTWKRRRQQLVLVYLVVALTIMQNIAFYGSPRYRAPIEPLLVLLVGGALWWLFGDESGMWRRFSRSKEIVREEVIQEEKAQEEKEPVI